MSAHLKEYLDYYQTLIAPGYAVLVTGAWGVGKTYQVQKAIRKEDYWYVSLYGLPTVNDIHAAVIAEAHPRYTRGQGIASQLGELVKSFWGPAAAASRISSLLTPILRRSLKPSKVLVFDDLERSNIPLKELLGVINVYLEHHGFRVIVIANDGKIKDDLTLQKEKLFGQSIKVNPELYEAYAHFSKRLSCPDQRKFISIHRDLICTIFQESQEQSLRILNHVIEDIGRLFDALDVNLHKYKDPLKRLVAAHCVLNVHIRAGTIGEVDLLNRYEYWFSYSQNLRNQRSSDIEKPEIVKIREMHQSVEFMFPALEDSILVDMLIKGKYSQEEIREALRRNAAFQDIESTPAWKIVWTFFSRSDEDLKRAIDKMNQQVFYREIVEPGEILHVFALYLFMAKEKWAIRSYDDVVNEGVKYIDGLCDAEKLKPTHPRYKWRDVREEYDGYGFMINEETKPYFQVIKEHLDSCQDDVQKNALETKAMELLNLMYTSPEEFLSKVYSEFSDNYQYSGFPLLSLIAPKTFVDAWLNTEYRFWRSISSSVELQLGRSENYNNIKVRDWAIAVLHEMRNQQQLENGPRATRITGAIPELPENIEREVQAQTA